MDSGKYDRRIRIETPPTAQHASSGRPTGSWTTVATVWANIQEVLPSKGESQAGGIRQAERPARIRIRYVSGITSAMRIVVLDRGNRVMKIISQPAEIGRKVDLEFMAADYSTAGNGA